MPFSYQESVQYFGRERGKNAPPIGGRARTYPTGNTPRIKELQERKKIVSTNFTTKPVADVLHESISAGLSKISKIFTKTVFRENFANLVKL